MMKARYEYAGFWIRAVAWIIDISIIMAIVYIVRHYIFGGSYFTLWSTSWLPFNFGFVSNETQSMNHYFDTLSLIIFYFYMALLESSRWRGTIGKKILGLSVSDTSDHRISFIRASVRFFGKLLSAIVLSIGYLMVAFTSHKRGLHDYIAGSVVVKKIHVPVTKDE
jgi:uncharacterized RDD family membrane protein YckC